MLNNNSHATTYNIIGLLKMREAETCNAMSQGAVWCCSSLPLFLLCSLLTFCCRDYFINDIHEIWGNPAAVITPTTETETATARINFIDVMLVVITNVAMLRGRVVAIVTPVPIENRLVHKTAEKDGMTKRDMA